MEQMSVNQFAGELKMPAAVLLEQLKSAGVDKSGPNELLTEQDKARLLEYLRRAHGDTQPKGKITLTRKQTSEIRATDSTGRARTVQVEVRKKRTFIKRDETVADAVAAPAVMPLEPAPAAAPAAEAAVVLETGATPVVAAVVAAVVEVPAAPAPVTVEAVEVAEVAEVVEVAAPAVVEEAEAAPAETVVPAPAAESKAAPKAEGKAPARPNSKRVGATRSASVR